MAAFSTRKNGVLAEVRRRVNGRTIYKSRLFPNKKNAEAWAAELEAKLLRGILPDDVEADKTIFRDLLRRYWDEVASKNKHYIRDRSIINQFAKSTLADLAVNQITKQKIYEWVSYRQATVKNSTVNRDLSLASTIFDTAINKWGAKIENPVRGIQWLRPPEPRFRRISAEEIGAVFRLLGFDPAGRIENNAQLTAAAFEFAIHSAMRLGEITHMEWAHVDFDQKFVHLPNSKTGKARDVPIYSDSIKILNRQKAHGFHKPFPIAARTVSKIFSYAIGCSDIENLHFHDSRHEALSRFGAALQMQDLMLISGITNAKTLMVYYNAKPHEISGRIESAVGAPGQMTPKMRQLMALLNEINTETGQGASHEDDD